MFGIQEHLIREVSGLKERSLGEEMDPVRSWVRNVGVVDANVAAQRYSRNPADVLTLPPSSADLRLVSNHKEFISTISITSAILVHV